MDAFGILIGYLVGLIISLLILYVVINRAVFNALREHSRWTRSVGDDLTAIYSDKVPARPFGAPPRKRF